MISTRIADLIEESFEGTLSVNSFDAQERFGFGFKYNGFNFFLKFGTDSLFTIPLLIEHIYQYFVLGNYILFPVSISFSEQIAKRSSDILAHAFKDRRHGSHSCEFYPILFRDKKYYVAPGTILDENFNILLAVCKQGIYAGAQNVAPNSLYFRGKRPLFKDTIPTFIISDSIYNSTNAVEKYILKEIIPYISTQNFFVVHSNYSSFVSPNTRVKPEIRICDTSKYTIRPTAPNANTNDKTLCESVLKDIKEIYKVEGMKKMFNESDMTTVFSEPFAQKYG